jgi:hypothetical protein
MTRAELEHVIRAAGTIANVDDVVVIGSQAVLGEFPDAPAELRVSNEADVFPREHPERSDLIDSTIGEGSPFQHAFGYFAHGVDETTAILPQGWRDRLILVSDRQIRRWPREGSGFHQGVGAACDGKAGGVGAAPGGYLGRCSDPEHRIEAHSGGLYIARQPAP